MRYDQNSDLAELSVGARAQAAEPTGHEVCFARPALHQCSADVEDVRLLRIEADPGAELPARARLPVKPVVKALRAGDDDAVGRDAVDLARLAALEVVPDERAR